jgi:ribosomal protein RSM22 (predicted rRNA methylase)
LGRHLAGNSYLASLRGATWDEGRAELDALPPAELVTLSYVVNELPSFDAAVRRAAEQAEVVVVIEPGTPAGFERIRAVRALLVEAGLRLVAPCPQSGACPIVAGRDWCHFAARIGRSALHRRLKGGDLSYEDEKFSYVAAVRSASGRTPGRVLRRPQLRKGLVSMSLCTPEGGIRPELVSKRQGNLYRAARDVDWGDSWPPDLA